MEADTQAITIAPAPKAVRGYPSSLDATQNELLFFNGNAVVLKSHKNNQVLILNHAADVAAVKLSRDQKLIASIDVKGTLIISEICPDRIIEVYKYQGVFPNAKDIDWSADRKKVCIVGQGKNKFAKVVSIDTGIVAGDITAVTATLNSCSFRPERPYKLVLGGDEYTVKCYDGPPYSFIKSDKSHSNFILKVKYSPKGTYFLTGGADRKLVIYDGKSYEKLSQKENAHGGSIFGLDWLSEEEFVTVSSDKLIKIWNIKFQEKAVIETASAEDMKNPKKIGLFLVAVKVINDTIYAVTLQGDILVYNNPSKNKQVSLVTRFSGPRSKIVKLLPWNQKTLILLDSGGRVLLYDVQLKATSTCAPQLEMNNIVNGFISDLGDKKRLVILSGNGVVWLYEGGTIAELSLRKKLENIEFKDIAEGYSTNQIVGLTNNKIVIFNLSTGKFDKEVTINEDVTCLQANQSYIIAGTIKGKIHFLSAQLQPIQVHTLNTFKVSNITLYPTSNPTQFRCLIGDSCGNMSMLDISPDGIKTVKQTMGGHTSVITGSGKNGNSLYTFAMDGKICVWQYDSLQRTGEIKQTVNGGIVCGVVFGKWVSVSGGNLITKLIPCQ